MFNCVQSVIESINSQILETRVDPQSNNIYNETGMKIVSPTNATRAKYHEGTTNVSFHWNYARVKFSRSYLNRSIAASSILNRPMSFWYNFASLITGKGVFPGGIWVDLNYFALGIGGAVGAATLGSALVGISAGTLASLEFAWDWQ